ncbi:hypothetical protein F5B22DRAFT_593012 [Xylaria bambusicola]|uniref:uncharacterized protein n=1 Tax=Xylaria bambusicola TaxID=326684 RepID=UPI00200802D5|nr:uncharacterized protein F5B22DRAFT_593012 [Xylaria bambusicola]KAI0522161.1 hypothetical protein F5B22DRAFT_593012 [Xylaria bambusicola]
MSRTMPYMRITLIAAVAAILLRGVRGGEIDAQIVQRGFNVGVSALQDETAALDTNLNNFDGNLFGAPTTPITFSGVVQQPFRVGTENLGDYRTAVNIACDRFQNQECKRAADQVAGSDKSDCDRQKDECQDFLNNPPTPRTYRVRMSMENDNENDSICDIDIPEPF